MRNHACVLSMVAFLCQVGIALGGPVTWHAAQSACPGIGSGTAKDPFCSIQRAIDIAGDGDSILVAAGVYSESLDFGDKAISLESKSGAGETTIAGTNARRVVEFNPSNGNDSRLIGFTIVGGSGGIRCRTSSPLIERCVITGNFANVGGGMLCNQAEPQIFDCIIDSNTASDNGGGLFIENHSRPYLRGCKILNNRAEQFNGGGLASTLSDAIIEDCEIAGNFARNGGGLYIFDNSNPTIRRCRIAENTAEPLNNVHGYGGGIVLSGGNPVVDQCQIVGNRADAAAGLGHGGPAGLVRACVFDGNIATRVGGGVLCNNSALLLECSLLANNMAGNSGGGIYNFSFGNPRVWASTIARNTAPVGGGVFAGDNSQPRFSSCLIWGNGANQIRTSGGGVALVTFSNVQGGFVGTGNSSTSPMFRSNTDFRLMPGSVAINAGVSEGSGLGAPTDLDGHARDLCGPVDRGAYEFGIGDYNCDQAVDLVDFSGWIDCVTGPEGSLPDPFCTAFDFDAGGEVDLLDFANWQRELGQP